MQSVFAYKIYLFCKIVASWRELTCYLRLSANKKIRRRRQAAFCGSFIFLTSSVYSAWALSLVMNFRPARIRIISPAVSGKATYQFWVKPASRKPTKETPATVMA